MIFQTLACSVMILAASLLVFISLLPSLFQRIFKEAKYPKLLFSLVLLGVLLRFVWIYDTQPIPFSDFRGYWHGAEKIAHGDFSPQGLIHTPGGSIFYSFVIQLFGPHLWAAWIYNLFFSVVLMLIMYLLGKYIRGEVTGLMALALCAIFPPFVTYSALINTEIPALTFFLLILWQVLEATRRGGVQRPIGFGLMMGLLLYGCILLRPTFSLLLFTLPIALWIYRKQSHIPVIKFSLSFIATIILLGSSWMYYQYHLTGIPRLSWCSVIWLGAATQYEEINGTPNPRTYEQLYPDIRKDLHSFDYHQRAKALLVMEKHFQKRILVDPIRYIQHGMLRMKATLWASRSGVLWSLKHASTGVYSNKTMRQFSEITTQLWRILLVIALMGMLMFRRKWDLPIVYGHGLIFVFGWLFIHYFFAAPSERYGIQLSPFIILYATVVFDALFFKRNRISNAKPA
jgi:4-amino-4-deoxy-L-arabinose transferase-like glycosyltransferase